MFDTIETPESEYDVLYQWAYAMRLKELYYQNGTEVDRRFIKDWLNGHDVPCCRVDIIIEAHVQRIRKARNALVQKAFEEAAKKSSAACEDTETREKDN